MLEDMSASEQEPIYKRDEIVSFFFRGEKYTGKILCVDAYGTFEQSKEPSYDIYDESSGIYKHILQSEVIGVFN